VTLALFHVKQGAEQHIERVKEALVGGLNQIIRHAEQLQLAGVVAFHVGMRRLSVAGMEQVHDAVPRGGDNTLQSAQLGGALLENFGDRHPQGQGDLVQGMGTRLQVAILDAGKVRGRQTGAIT